MSGPGADLQPGPSDALEDPRRVEQLEALDLLDSAPEEDFDRFTRLAAKILDVPVALVSLVAPDRQYFKSCVGLAEPWASRRQTPLSHSFCQYVVVDDDELVIEDARRDPRLEDSGAIRDLGVIAYLGVPLRTAGGAVLGSLCAIDSEPRRWQDEDVETMRDLAAAVSAELELRALSRDLQRSHLDLRQRELQRDELRQLLVHDMRNPLGSVIGALDLIAMSGQLTGRPAKHLELGRESAHGLLRLIDDILYLDRADGGRLELDLERLQPAEVIDEARRLIESLAEISGVALVFDLPGDLPDIAADRGQLVRMLVNLLGNAVQHTPAGGRVTLRSARRDGALVIEVEDTGRGIPESAFELIFERFGQVEARASRPSSTGLGLPSCKMVVTAHGGDITVASQLGRGTIFTVTLPCLDSGECDGVRSTEAGVQEAS